MKRFSLFIIAIFLLFLYVRPSLSFGGNNTFNAASDCKKNCSDTDLQNGEDRLYSNFNAYNNLHDGCMNDNWATWCCICEHPEYYHYPSICTQYTLSCPIGSPTPVPIDGGWSNWGTCSKLCDTGTQYRTCTNPAPQYGGNDCQGNNSQNCNTQHCPVDCTWGSFGACLKNGSGCAQKRVHTTEAAYGGSVCVGSDTQVCYACTDTGSTATASTTQGEGIQIILNTYTGQSNTTQAPTITQARSQNAGFDLFRPPSPTPTRIPSTPTPQPTTPPQQPNNPHNEPSPTMIPTSTPIPTVPPESIIPESLASQQQNVGGGTSYQVDTSKITNISVAPGIVSKNKPILSQEQRLLANNTESPVSGGIMVGLQQKTGSQFVTQQDELMVKRGNQFFSISNQTSSAPIIAKNQIAQKTSNTGNNTAPSPQLEINANNVVAYSSMGLSIDPLSGVLTVETPTGPQKVSIMPDEALGIIIELKALTAGGTEPSILLVSEKGKLIYRITGEKVEKFFGLLPVSIQKQVLVSADTGSIITIELSLLSRIMSFFTF